MKPNPERQAAHQRSVMTERQKARMASGGSRETTQEDLRVPTKEDLERRNVRKALEDLQDRRRMQAATKDAW